MNKEKKIVMITMFKNEAKTIRRMLKSCYKYIDYWVFQDNGSTDGTPEIVKEFFEEHPVPGFIYNCDEGWVSFGWNRDHLLQTCLKTDHGCDWIMKMDCDEYMEVDDGFDWSIFNDTDIHSFHVPSIAPGITYFRAWIWNAKFPWKFNHDLIHETISLEMDGIGENFQRVNLPMGFRHIGTNDGESYQTPTKYVSDALKLEEQLIREDTMLSDNYHFWYVGKSYFDAHFCQNFPLGKVQQDEFARRSVFYFYQYVCHNHEGFSETHLPNYLDEFSYFGLYCSGMLLKDLGCLEDAIENFNTAALFCPRRNEHLVRLAEICMEQEQYDTMLSITTHLMSDERKNPFPDFIFLIDNSCYHNTGDYVQELHTIAKNNVNQ